jgi:aspartate aminotransferase
LEKAITSRTKLLILNSPSNPTGSVYTLEELEDLAEVILRHNFYVVSDDIYEKLLFDGLTFVNIAQVAGMKERTFVVNGVSKSYAMTGWRIGYVAGPREVVAGMTKIQSQSTSNPNSIAQKAALAAIQGPQGVIKMMVDAFDKRRKYLVERLNGITHVSCRMPQGAFYTFPNFSSYFKGRASDKQISDSAGLAEYLLTVAKVALVPGIAFGADRFIRFSYATSLEVIKEGLDRIEGALGKLSF